MKLHPWRVFTALLSTVLLVPCVSAFAAQPFSPLETPVAQSAEHPVGATEVWGKRVAAGSPFSAAELRLKGLEQKAQLRTARAKQGKAAVVRPAQGVKVARVFSGHELSASAIRGNATNATNATIAGDWTSLGPAPVISDPGIYGQDYGAVSGRVTAVAVDPNDATGNTVYAGAAVGGLWKSTNATASAASVVWTPLLDAQATLAVGAVAVQPGNGNVILVGTGEADGTGSYFGLGVLRSTDGGTSWTQIATADSGSHSFAGLGFSKIAFSSVNPSLAVAAVSGATNGSSLGAVSTLAVTGLYYSTDAGASWHLATASNAGVAISPAASATDVAFAAAGNSGAGTFYAAVQDHGVFSSNDGIAWSQLAAQPSTSSATATGSLPFHTGRLAVVAARTELYAWFVDEAAGDRGISRSNDGGATWTTLDGTGIDSCGDSTGCGTPSASALTLAAVPLGSTGTDLYAGATNLYKCSTSDATDAGSTCQAVSGTTSAAGFVNLTHVYGCGGPLATTAHMHGGQHSVAAQLLGSGDAILYMGNDGGAYRALSGQALLSGGVSSSTCTGSNPFDNLTGTLGSLSEVVGFAQHPTDATTYLAGLQDNGAAGVSESYNVAPRYGSPLPLATWTSLGGINGSNGFSEIDSSNPDYWYTAKAGGEVDLCTAGTTTPLGCIEAGFSPVGVGYPGAASNPWSGDPTGPFTAFVTDPQLAGNLLVGTCRVWRGNGVTGVFSPISPEFDFLKSSSCLGTSQRNVVSAIAAGGATTANGSQVIYIGTAGSGTVTAPTSGRVFATTSADSGNSVWREVTGAVNPMGFDISSIYADSFNDPTGFTAYLAVKGYLTQAGGRVWKTTNAGGLWTDISRTLPNIPVSSVVLDPVDHTTLYAGTDIGVFVTQDSGASWAEYGTGLPNAPVSQLRVFNSGGVSELRVATYGRGLWSIPLLGVSSTLPNFSFGGVSSGVSVLLGGSVATSFTLTSTNGFAGDVTFSCPAPPDGVSCSFDAGTVTLASGGSATVNLTISATTSALAQLVNLSLQATSGNTTQETTIPVTVTGVQPTFVFRLSAPDVISTAPGGSIAYGLSIESVSGFSEAVTFTCIAGIPQGATCLFSPSVVTGAGNSTLTIQTAPPVKTASIPKPDGSWLARTRSAPLPTALWMPLAGLTLLGFGVGLAGRQRVWRSLGVVTAMASVALWLACSGGSSTTTSTSGVAVTISPTIVSLFSGATQQFSAIVTGSTNTTVTWGASPGTIDTNGFYTAPFYTGTKAETATVTATALADTTQSAKSTVTINAYNGGTPPGNYTVTVRATSTHASQTGTVNITVQ